MIHRLPPLLLGLIVAAYWFRVMRMAHKARRRTGRAANFLPREALGRAVRLVWVPVVMVWVGHPFLTALAAPRAWSVRSLWHIAWLTWLGVAAAAACFWATRACWRQMGRSWRMGIDPGERTDLVTRGPFAYVRHPIYALSQGLMIASVAVIGSPLMIAAGAAHVGLLQWEARREEAYLLRVHGDAYAGYRARVGRFIPALRG